jgi:microcystin-dependent protein
MSGIVSPGGVPVGSVLPFAGATAPVGWLLCGGQAVSRTVNAGLFAAIGTTFGVGDGSTTFNVPDLRGRVAAGVDNMGGTAANRMTVGGSGIAGTTLGNAGGTETHTLTTAQLAVHSHTISGGVSGGAGYLPDVPPNGLNIPVNTGNAGSGNAHQNTQPTLMLNYIIKV